MFCAFQHQVKERKKGRERKRESNLIYCWMCFSVSEMVWHVATISCSHQMPKCIYSLNPFDDVLCFITVNSFQSLIPNNSSLYLWLLAKHPSLCAAAHSLSQISLYTNHVSNVIIITRNSSPAFLSHSVSSTSAYLQGLTRMLCISHGWANYVSWHFSEYRV